MSQSHAILTWENGKPFIQDNQSTNGTWIESLGVKFGLNAGEKHKLESDQVLIFGKEITAQDIIHKPLRLKIVVLGPPLETDNSVEPEPESVKTPPPYSDLSIVEPGLDRQSHTQAGSISSGSTMNSLGDVSAQRRSTGFGLTEKELMEESGSDMNLDSGNDEHITDESSDEENITDEVAAGWDDDDPAQLPTGWSEIERVTRLTAYSFEDAYNMHTTNSTRPSVFAKVESDSDNGTGSEGSESASVSSDDEPGLTELCEELDEDEEQDGLDYGGEDVEDIFEDPETNDLAELEALEEAAGDYFNDHDSDHSSSHDAELALLEGLFSHEVEVEDAEMSELEQDDPIEYSDPASAPVLTSGPSAVTSSRQHKSEPVEESNDAPADLQPHKTVAMPPGRVPSPFRVPDFDSLRKATDDGRESASSPLPSPLPSPEQQPVRYFAKRTKPVPIIFDEDSQAEDEEVEAVPKRAPVRDYSSRRKPISIAGPNAFSLTFPGSAFSSYGTIRKPKLHRYLGDSEDEDDASQTSHLPSPKNSPERAASPELGAEPESKRARFGSDESRPKVNWGPVIEHLDDFDASQDEGSVVEGVYDGLDEMDEDVQAELEVDGNALQEVDEVAEVDGGTHSSVLADVFEELKVVAEARLSALEKYKDAAYEKHNAVEDAVTSESDAKSDHKPDIASLPLTSSIHAHLPTVSLSLSPKKRDRAHLDDQAELNQIVQDCVAHVAEEARTSQLEGTQAALAPVAAAADASFLQLDPQKDEVAKLVAPVVTSTPAHEVLATQTEAVVVEKRAIAPLPKRARGKGLLTFLSGMAVAVVGMECLGILAGMMEE